VAGLLGGLLGVGGGFALVPLQVMFARVDQRHAHGTSLAAIIPGALVGALIYYFGSSRPQVDLRFAALLVLGSAAGAYLGARVMTRIPDRPLRLAFAVALLLVGLKELVAP
jgi:uncharacterized membrane protein YfcA